MISVIGPQPLPQEKFGHFLVITSQAHSIKGKLPATKKKGYYCWLMYYLMNTKGSWLYKMFLFSPAGDKPFELGNSLKYGFAMFSMWEANCLL